MNRAMWWVMPYLSGALAIVQASTLNGVIIDPDSNRVEGVFVSLSSAETGVLTDRQGRFSLEMPSTGVKASKRNLPDNFSSGRLSSGNAEDDVPTIYRVDGRRIIPRKPNTSLSSLLGTLSPGVYYMRNPRRGVRCAVIEGRACGEYRLSSTSIFTGGPVVTRAKGALNKRHILTDSLCLIAEGYTEKRLLIEWADGEPVTIMIKPLPSAVTPDERESMLCGFSYAGPGTFAPDTLNMWYVTPDENIQDIITATGEFDIVNVAPGHYRLDSSIVLHRPVLLRSIAGPEKTIIDGQGYSRCVLMSGTNTVLDGFTLVNGDADGPRNWGLADYDDESKCDDGGGVFTCGCECTMGYLTGPGPEPIIRNCRIFNCHAGAMGGGGVHLKGGHMQNCLIAYNTVSHGKGAAVACKDRNVTIENCTITGNESGIWIRQQALSTIRIFNSIVIDNGGPRNWQEEDYKHIILQNCLTSSDIIEKAERDGDIEVFDCITGEPGFVAPADTNFRLEASSPCLDAGHTGEKSVCTDTDLGMSVRVWGPAIDIGAYEREDD
ncbi:MAG: hypothetical protein GF344_09435 [Chitinivibrionales bacterium]|nr:hypothetical protein [Chitinivibrionales bacterium]